jgi:NAD(P)-dependent dehydrogenase (short-subunit alcohol dehydrogenase family)
VGPVVLSASAELPLRGAVAVVTGGNGGIGLGLAAGLTRAGAQVAIWARNESKTADAVQRLEQDGASVVGVRCDVANEADVETAMAETVDRFGKVDSMFANAGVTGRTVPFVDLSLEEWREVNATNVEGTFLCLRAAARHLIARGSPGALVGVSSIIAFYGAAGKEHYAASKTSIGAIVNCLAVELGPYGIRANTLVPGWIDTDILAESAGFTGTDYSRFQRATVSRTPVKRWGVAADFEAVAVFLADPKHSFHTGDSMVVDGGYTLM